MANLLTEVLSYPLVRGLLKIGFVIVFFVLSLTPLLVIIERRLSAFMQGRIGPNRVGPQGLLQPLADLIKFLFKEDIIPEDADKFLYLAGPVLVLVPPALGMIVIPFGNQIGDEPLQVANLNIGILFTMSVLSVAVYGLAFGGWASNSKFSLLGGLRASAQLISYELALGLSIIVALMLSGTVDPRAMVTRQIPQHAIGSIGDWFSAFTHWNILGGGNLGLAPFGILGSILFFVSALAENNRLPFDLPECEAELVGGYHTEYSSIKFALFMMGEYVGMILMSSLLVTFFLGGWYFPGITNPHDHSFLAGVLSVAVFVAKIMAILTFYVVIRWTLPRFKYNQLMNLGWKRLVPLALANVMAVAVVGVLTSTGGGK
jgi:NADH-quinone oxidoreductase subunit H